MTKQELKDSIALVVKTNGDNEITGANLQAKLFEIVDECYGTGGGSASLYNNINELGAIDLDTLTGEEKFVLAQTASSAAYTIDLLTLKQILDDNPYSNGIVYVTESRDFEANDEGKLIVVGNENDEVILTMPAGQIFQGGQLSLIFLTYGGYQIVPNGNIIYPFHKPTINNDENTQGQFLQFLSFYNEENTQSGLSLLSSSDGFIIDPLDNTKSISTINYLMRVISNGLQGITDINPMTDGDIEITDTTKGYILKSPNGTRWRVTINDSGDLITTSL